MAANPQSEGHLVLIEQLRKLQVLSDAALSHLTLRELLEELVAGMRDAFASDTAAVLLREGDELVVRAASGIDEAGVRIPIGQGFAGQVAAERRTIALENVDAAPIVNEILRQGGIKSLLGAPLVAEGETIGVIHVGSRSRRRFTNAELELIELAAERAARGVEKALLHERLLRLDELKQSFVAIASHELRTPAMTLHGAASTLFQRFDDLSQEQVRQLVQMLYEQSARLMRLTQQLLDLSRLDTDSIRIEPSTFKVREHLQAALAGLLAEHQGIEIDAAPELHAVADADAFDQVIANLVANAFSHGAEPVTVRAERRDRHLRVSVEDAGAGVPPEFVPSLFERFRRGPSEHLVPGAGLGLAIARSYARAHGGDLFYEPLSPHGSRFELVLPQPGL
ncbi:MAG: GAF domain-containing sensor histidine kinase [Gaiellaceae bacterium]